MRRILSFALATAVSASCVTAGGKPYKEAERFRTEGKLADAKRAYQDALRTEPGNKTYQARLSSLDEQIELEVERLRSEAKEKEKASDWTGASATYGQALDLKPGDADLAARKALTAAKAKNLDPDAWFSELEKILTQLPGNAVVERSMAGARAGAYQYHVALGAKLLEAGDGQGALGHYERAKAIDASTPGWSTEQYDRARALDLAAQADLRVIAGDAVEAFDLLTKANELWSNPELKKKLAEAKGRASAILKKLEVARAAAEKKRWADALRAYEDLGGLKGVPASVSAEASAVRVELAKQYGSDAEAAAAKGDLKRAKSAVLDALKYAELGAGPTEGAKLAIELASAGEAGKAQATLDAAGVADPSISAACQAIVRSAAKARFAKAQAVAKKDAAGALAILAELEPFAASMPEIAVLKQSLRKDAFQGLLDDALTKARAGDDKAAGENLLAALRASKAPANVATPIEEGARALSGALYTDAERSFQAALAVAARSVLAQRGLDIVRLRMSAGEKDALAKVKAGGADLGPAVAVLEAARLSQPGNTSASEGAKALTSRLEGNVASLDDLSLARDLGYAARLSELPAAARTAFEAGNAALAQGDHSAAEQKYKQAETAAPDAKIPAIARSAAKSRMMVALKSGAKAAAGGDEGSGAALKKLLEADPNDAEAKATLEGLHTSAREAGKKGDFAGAARFLGVALAATSPAPGVKDALQKGNTALAAGDLAGAESAYSDATDLEASNGTAKAGYELAKAARLEGLRAAVAEAKTGNTEQAAAALQKTLEVDSSSSEAREAFKELIATAKARGDEGKDREAARLLEAANTVSKPETAKKAIAAATALLGEGKHAEAEAAFEKVLSTAESQVARAGQDIARGRKLAVLLAGVELLKNGSDLERGTAAVQALLKLDATNAEALAAIDATLARAEAAAERGEEKQAAAELRAADQASGTVSGMPKAIADLERGKFDDAESAFGRLSGPVASRGVGIAKKRKVATLKAGMSGGDDQKATAIQAMLAQDPNNKEAKAELSKLYDRARGSAKKGNDADAAKALEIATKATGAPEELAGPLVIAAGHLAEGRYAEAERNFSTALEINRSSPVADVGLSIARDKRKDAEKAAIAAINKGEDPLKHAQVLQATLIVEPKAKSVSEAFGKLVARAKTSATKGNVVDTARTLDAAAMLEGLPAPMVQKITEANAALAANKFGEAESAYAAALGGDEARASQVAEIGKGLARARLLAELRADLALAQKEKDLFRASARVKAILELDPNDKAAKALAPKLGGDVAEDRYQAAMTQKGYGKLGVAHLYLTRALAVDPSHKKAQEELAAVEKALSESLDLVVRVSEVQRKGGVSGCADVEASVREALMKTASERTDLGLYVLGASWTAKVDKNAPDAPKVGGGLDVTLVACTSNASTGKAKVEWKLKVPGRDGKVLAEATADADVPSGMVPRDEQDAAGKNARAVLAKRTAAAIVGGVESAREKVNAWLLVRAEHFMGAKDVAAAAESLAQLRIKKVAGLDDARVAAVQAYLDGELK